MSEHSLNELSKARDLMLELRTRAEAAEKERDNWIETARLYAENSEYHQSKRAELKAENERLKAENLAMRNCQNCDGYDIVGCESYYDCKTGCGQGDVSYWKAVKND